MPVIQEPKSLRDAFLPRIVDALCAHSQCLTSPDQWDGGPHLLPSRSAVADLVECLRAALFPGYFGPSEVSAESLRFHVGSKLDQIRGELFEQITRSIRFFEREKPPSLGDAAERAHLAADALLGRLPEVRRLLASDIEAAYAGDPAATSRDEALLCYPGMIAITNQRLAHELYRLEIPLLPRIITELAHSSTGIDIHPGASIGDHFFIDHGTGVVVGETCRIGQRVRIYQGVTLGAKSFPLDEHGNPMKGIPRHPIVEDDVTIYGGATILGRITIGRGSVIGGNVWLTHGVPPNTRVTQAESRRQDVYGDGAGI